MKLKAIPVLERQARQRPNPELETEYLSRTSGGSGHEGEAALLHTWESGGKRSARLDRARAEAAWLTAQRDAARASAAVEAARGLARLRHIAEELAVAEESIHTFETILGQYKKRSRLSPEQSVSLSVFDLAKREQTLHRTRLIQERSEWVAFFRSTLDQDIGKSQGLWKPLFEAWPALPERSSAPGGAERRVLEAALAQGRVGENLARSESWPDISLGPRLSFGKEGGERTAGVGANLSLALPLYQRNAGGRAMAEAETRVAASDLEQADRGWKARDAALREAYQETVQLLEGMPSLEEVEKKHRELERLFERGLVDSALVIEAHRQRAEWTESRNAAESRALEAYLTLKAMNTPSLEDLP